MVLAGALARKSGRRAGTAPEWPLCRRLARLRGAAPRPLGRAMAPLPGRPPPRCVAGLPRRKPASDGGRPQRARYCCHTNSFRIASSLHSDVIFGRDGAHSMSFCRLFLHLVAGRRRGGALLSNYPCHSPEYRLFAIRTSAGPRQPLRILIAGNHDEATMGILFVWVIEFIKLLGRRRLHPLNAECPICHQMVRLHYNKAGRRHLLAHARACSLTLYEGARYCVHYTAKIKCLGSGTLAKFDPRPNENQHFKLPKFLELEGWSTPSSERGDVRLRTRTDRQSGHSHSAVP